MTDQPRLTEADRPVVLGWVADALDGVAVPQAISALLRKAAATEPEDEILPVPEVGKLYEFDTIDPDGHYPPRTHSGWWNGYFWIACFGLGWSAPESVTGFRPYNPVAAEPVPMGPMVEPTRFGDMVETDEGPAVVVSPCLPFPWLLRGATPESDRLRAWSELANPRPYKADGAVQ